MARTDRDVILFSDGAVLAYSRTVERGRVIRFRLQLRVAVGGAMRNILRYDHAHGRPVHRHSCWLPGEPAEDVGPFADLDEAWDWCLDDLRAEAAMAVQAAETYFTKRGQ